MPATRDPGLQPERTTVAWTRTCTALIAVGLLGTRLHAGAWPILISLAGLLSASGLMVAAAVRGRTTSTGLTSERIRPPCGLALTLTGLVVLLALVSLVAVLLENHV